jgi:hypothetical protein
MPTFVLTDNLNNPISLPVKLSDLSGLFKYLRSEALHLMVFPDFLAHKDDLITVAAPKPITAQLKVGNQFQLGGTSPEISVSPTAEIDLIVNTNAGSNLFDGDPFAVNAVVPVNSAYSGLTIDGSLDAAVSGTSGDLTFGFDRNTDVKLAYFRAFPSVGPGVPTLGEALAETIANYVIPADLADAGRLQPNDIATVSGRGRIKISGGAKVSVSPNPLASVSLPLNAGTVTVQEGAMAGLTVSVQVTGSYQVRLRRLNSATIELSFLKEKGTMLKADLSGSAGITADIDSTDLIKLFLGAIDPQVDHSELTNGGLTADETKTLSDAIKSSINQSFQASFDDTLSSMTDEQAAFQYQIDVIAAQQDATASDAVSRALEGDLSFLTALESGIGPDGTIAPGVKMINSVFSTSVKKESAFKVNLLGLINVLSLSDLLRSSKVIEDPVSGDLTVADSVTGTQINSIVAPLDRQKSLRKAMFDSLLVTAAYKTSGAVTAFGLSSSAFHFALNQNTDLRTMTGYLSWLVAFGVLTPADKQSILGAAHFQGSSTCLIRTSITDAQSRSMFFDDAGNLRPEAWYLDYGRRAMMALLTDKTGPFDDYRYNLLNEQWEQAVATGPSPELAQVAGITSANPNYQFILDLLTGDVAEIVWWESAMVNAGKALETMSQFLSNRNPALLKDDQAFEAQRVSLQKKMEDVVSKSKARFDGPWGLLSLYWTAGSPGASATLRSQSVNFTKIGSSEMRQHA